MEGAQKLRERRGGDVSPPGQEAGTHWSRGRLLRRAGLAGVTLSVGGALIGRRLDFADSATAQDVKVLQFALLAERLQEAFYADANKRGELRGEVAEFAEVVGGHEREHVAFLREQLKGSTGAQPDFDFGDATGSERAFVPAAVQIEDLTLHAYNGQATNLSPPVLAAAARIVSVEARHAAWIRDIAGESPAPRASDLLLTEKQVRDALKKTGFVKS